jgi:glycosyltransferase involved in cell wall biosynthesis
MNPMNWPTGATRVPCRTDFQFVRGNADGLEIRPTSEVGRALTVALVSTQRLWHGGEEQAALLARGLRRRGHRAVILARHDGQFVQGMADEGFEVLGFRGNGRSPMAFWQIRALLRRLRPDVLHYNDPHAVSAAGLASVGLGIGARVAMRHVCFPIRWTFRYRAFCDRVVCVSHAVAQTCRESGISSQAVRVVHGGMDPERWQAGDRARGRAALGIRDGQILLLTVAQLVQCKGHADLLEALRAVARERPEVQLALAGDGPLKAALLDQARRLGIDSRVHFLGHRRDVPDLLAAADLFVLPSLSEALSVALMEAMLAGCAVVTTTAGGIPDLTGDNDAGGASVAWTVPPGDPPALAGAILEALADHPLRADRITRARRRALERFTVDRMVEATLGVYSEVLGVCRADRTE